MFCDHGLFFEKKKPGYLHILNFANMGHIFSMWRPCFGEGKEFCQILSDICKGGKECSF